MKNNISLVLFGIVVCVNIGYAQIVDLELGLQLHYPFSGNTADASGNGNDGIAFGDPVLTTDRFGVSQSAYLFDGIDDLIRTNATFDLSNRTLSLWIETYNLSGFNTTAHVAITQDDNELDYGILRVDFANDQMKLWAGGLTGTYVSDTILTNSWMHLVLIREGDSTRYYVNCQLVHTSTAETTGSTFNPNPELIIGGGRSYINQFFDGKIDDIRIYDRALNALEIDSLCLTDFNATGLNETASSSPIKIYPNPIDKYFVRLITENGTRVRKVILN